MTNTQENTSPRLTFPQLVAENVRIAREQVKPGEMIVVSGEMLINNIREVMMAARQVGASHATPDSCVAYMARLALLGATCQLVAESIISERKGVIY